MLENGTTVLFDGYNANPESMAVLIKNLFEIFIEGKKVAVLGDMFELGDKADEAHQALGEMVGNTDYDVVWFIGDHAPQFEAGLKLSGFSKTYFISSTYEEELALKIASVLEQQDIVVDLGIGPEPGKRFVYATTDLGVEGKGADVFVIDSDLVANALSRTNVMSLDSFREFVQDVENHVHRDDFISALNSAEELSDQQALEIFIQLHIQHASGISITNEPNAEMHV